MIRIEEEHEFGSQAGDQRNVVDFGIRLADIPMMDEDRAVIVEAPTQPPVPKRPSPFKFNLPFRFNGSTSSSPASSSTNSTASEDGSSLTDKDELDGRRKRKRHISKPLDIGFRNLSYSVKTGFVKRGN